MHGPVLIKKIRAGMGIRASKLSIKIVEGRRYKRLGGCSSLTPRGYVPICVGVNDDTRRFIVHTATLGDADLLEFLCKSAEEYGFCNQGVLRIPCEAKDFEERMIKMAKRRIIRV